MAEQLLLTYQRCNKVAHRIECVKCGYPYSEAMYPDNPSQPLPCNAADNLLKFYIALRECNPYVFIEETEANDGC